MRLIGRSAWACVAVLGAGLVLLLSALMLENNKGLVIAALICIAVGVFMLFKLVFLPIRDVEEIFAKKYHSLDDFYLEIINRKPVKTDMLRTTLLAFCEQVYENYASNLHTKQAELSALQSQINPHFLYNTLDSIRGQALHEGAVDIAEMAEALSGFFRYSISNQSTIVSLAEELENVKTYFKIQQFRFNNRFHLYIHPTQQDNLEQCLLPKLSIQPVVENAILHGIEGKLGEGSIEIEVEGTERTVSISISDNGVGMSAEQLRNLQDSLRQVHTEILHVHKNGSSTGIALSNVADRIRLLYGEQYGMQITSTPEVGTTVTFTLPRRIGKREHEA